MTVESIENLKESPGLVVLSYVRSLVALPLVVLWTFGYGSAAILTLLLVPSNRVRDFIYRTWGKGCCALYGLDIEVRGAGNFPRPGTTGVIGLFNHSSNFDIPIVHTAINGSVRWGAKVELFKIPIFGSILKSMGVLPIARANREEVFKVYEQSIPRVQKGECFMLAPEGTRKDGQQIHPFKTGPFIFAIQAQAPIVPVVICGAWRVQSKGQILPCWGRWHHKIVVEVLPPIATAGLSLDQRPIVQDKAFRLMSDTFAALQREIH
ncbi:MAG: 1-acyl-sn-glycerol-3-phosphate acyltransferase [Bdellovibrionales bacterium]|nr:1-acyl-sn-glycerol-3-phosphate acyltransferase [Bdellovibrionales bacterium]